MRWLFLMSASLIAMVYYVGASRDADALGKGMTTLVHAMTGRNEVGTFAPYPSGAFAVEEVEDESPYYFPDTPKEEPIDMRYYA